MSKVSKTKKWHLERQAAGYELLELADRWRHTALLMADFIRDAHDVAVCEDDKCRLCTALLVYQEARHG